MLVESLIVLIPLTAVLAFLMFRGTILWQTALFTLFLTCALVLLLLFTGTPEIILQVFGVPIVICCGVAFDAWVKKQLDSKKQP